MPAMSSPCVPLDVIGVASPCHASWEGMVGDNRSRFCGECQKNVYNLSGMTKDEAEALVNAREGKLCVRFYRRADGTVLTEDCPVGLRWARRKLAGMLTGIAAAIAVLIGGIALGKSNSTSSGSGQRQSRGLMTRFGEWLDPPLTHQVMGDVAPPSPPMMGKMMVMGEMVCPTPPVPPANTNTPSPPIE
jgi:hypothetical protein